jgi:hypothetical protein
LIDIFEVEERSENSFLKVEREKVINWFHTKANGLVSEEDNLQEMRKILALTFRELADAIERKEHWK